MNQSFVEHLIELRNQYRIQQLENEQRKHRVAQQLTHVDALLVDQLESSNLLESLVELRHQYQQQVAECDRQVAHCRDQLSHVNALLADQIVQQHEHLSLQATVAQRSLKEAPKLADDELPEEGRWEKGLDDLASSSAETHDRTANSFQPAVTEQLVTDSEQTEPETNFSSSLLPQYQHLTKPEALRQLLEEKAGSALHIDWLLHELYGELAEEQTAAERDRLSGTLKDGVEQGLWQRVPGAPECYTLDLKLIDPDPAKKNTQKQQDKSESTLKTKPTLTVLPKYSGLKLIDAVERIVTDYAGQQLTTDLVVKALYGDVSGRGLSEAKEIVGRALRRGVDAGRWQHVPRQKGVYTLDLRIVDPASSSKKTASTLRTGRDPLKVLPAYSRMSFTDAIATVLRNHAGEVMMPEQIARILFGNDITGKSLSTAKKRVSRALWEGASRKKWRRLSGEIGRYTLDPMS